LSLNVDHAKAAELEREFDAEMRFRPLGISGTWIVAGLLLSLSLPPFLDDVRRSRELRQALQAVADTLRLRRRKTPPPGDTPEPPAA